MARHDRHQHDGWHLPQWVQHHWPVLQQPQRVLRRDICWPDGHCEPADLFVGDEFVRAGTTLLDVVLRAPGGVAVLVFDKHRRELVEYESRYAPEAITVCDRTGREGDHDACQATLPAACADDQAH